jgi:hypothetical protein
MKALSGANNIRTSLVMSKLRSNIRANDRSIDNVHKYTSAELEGSPIIIKHKSSGGFGIYAGKDIEINSIILLERPFVSFNDDVRGNRCAECHKSTRSPSMQSSGREEEADLSNAVICKCGESYCSEQCKEVSAVKYHNVLCSTRYKDLEAEIIATGMTSSSRYVCLIMKLIAMVSNTPLRRVSSDGISTYRTPLDASHLKLLHRMTDNYNLAGEGLLSITPEHVPVGHLIKIDDMLKKYLGTLYTENPALDLDFLAQMYALLQCNTYQIKQGNSFINVCKFE